MKTYRQVTATALALALLSITAAAAGPLKKAGRLTVSYNEALSEGFRDFWAAALTEPACARELSVGSPSQHGPQYYLPVAVPQRWENWDGKQIGVAEFEIALPPGKTLFLSAFGVVGESHRSHEGVIGSGAPDDPPWSWSWMLPPCGEVVVLLDGKVLVDENNLAAHIYGPIVLPEPIWYDAATDAGATGAIWVEGIGVVLPQLRLGKHVLTVFSSNVFSPLSGDGCFATYTLNIVPPGRK